MKVTEVYVIEMFYDSLGYEGSDAVGVRPTEEEAIAVAKRLHPGTRVIRFHLNGEVGPSTYGKTVWEWPIQ